MKKSETAAAARKKRAGERTRAAAAGATAAAASRKVAPAGKGTAKPAARAAATAVATKSAPPPKRAAAPKTPPEAAAARAEQVRGATGSTPAARTKQAESKAAAVVAAVKAEAAAAAKAAAPQPAPKAAAPQPAPKAAPPAGPKAVPPAAAKAEAPKAETPKAETPKAEAAKTETPKTETPKAPPAAKPPVPEQPETPSPETGTTAAATPAVEATPAQPAPRPAADVVRRPPAGPGTHGGPITPPRPMAKAEIFQEGDHVVYPTHGVGKVERIATEEIAGHKLELIHITFEENRMTLRVPVSKARTAGLRKLATRKLFEEALNVLKGRARIKRTMWSRRAQEYEAKINSGDPLAIAEVVRDLHRNAGQPDQSFSERQIYEAAMERLAAELAALDKTDKMTAATKLTEFLKTV